MTTKLQDLQTEIDEMETAEVVVATNGGTYGAAECCRRTGSGDPRYGDYTIYERIGDRRRRTEGCDPADAPGRARKCTTELREKRARLAELRRLVRCGR